VNAVPVVVGAGKPRIVFESLALRANSVVRSDVLVEALWADHVPTSPGPQLQVYAANLRRLLDPDRSKVLTSQRLASRSGGYVLTVSPEELDLLRFRDHVAAGRLRVEAGDLVGGADSLRRAVELFRGPVFPDLAEIDMFRAELEALDETRLNVYQDLVEVELALGRHASLVAELQSVIAEQPYRERLWASLVIALYRSDRQADALAACRHAHQMFVDELGIDPGPRLRQLERLVLRQDPSLAAPAADGRRRARRRLNNLPAEVTQLVGRNAELNELCSLYVGEHCRLVTVSGPGGVGKTRLGMAAADQLGTRMPDGVCWVNLAPLTQVEQVPAAIAAALGLEEAGADPLRAATHFLRSRQLLLVLDNFEHLEDAWPVVLELLTAASDLRVLITSRRPLGLRGEYEFELAPLTLPPLDPPLPEHLLEEVPAVKLFVTRGRAVRRDFAIDHDNGRVVAQICHRLDGLPLAIELAAAQLRHRSERALLEDLELSLAALPPAFRDLPDRQLTITATIAWSYRLLGDVERDLFDQLGVFAADPTFNAVNLVCEGSSVPIEDSLTVLARHSVLACYTDLAGVSRLSMLQSIREFARNRLAAREDAAAVRRRHAEYYLSLAESLGPQLWGPDQVHAFRQLDAEAPDLRGALLWASGPDGSTDVALRLIGQLWHYWELTEDVAEPCRIAVALADETLDASPTLTGPALSGTATMCWILGRRAEATNYHRRALHAFRCAGNKGGVAWSRLCLAVMAAERDEPAVARRLAEKASSSVDATPGTRASAMTVLGLLAFYTRDHARALDLSRESVQLARPLGDRWLLGIVLTNLAECVQQAGDYAAAETLLREALGTALELGARGHVVAFLETLAGIYVAQRRAEQATRVLAATDAHRSDRGLPLNSSETQHLEMIIAKARTDLGPIGFGLAWADGEKLTLDQIVQEVKQTEPRRSPQESIVTKNGATPQPANASTAAKLNAAPWF
jgi:predicted ATPase/DNA-binding SARP family transcriptional activator